MSNMVERVARAIARDVPLLDGGQWAENYYPDWPTDYQPSERAVIRGLARAAIKAMHANLMHNEHCRQTFGLDGCTCGLDAALKGGETA